MSRKYKRRSPYGKRYRSVSVALKRKDKSGIEWIASTANLRDGVRELGIVHKREKKKKKFLLF